MCDFCNALGYEIEDGCSMCGAVGDVGVYLDGSGCWECSPRSVRFEDEEAERAARG